MDYIVQKNDELIHYGVKGMKWGVRNGRIQAETGDSIGGVYTTKQKNRIKRQAEKILVKKIKREEQSAASFSKAAEKHYKKADKLVYKSEDRQRAGDQKGFEKYQGKAWKHLANQYTNQQAAERATKTSQVYKKKLDAIQDGTLKAGKDYVTNMTVSSNIPLSMLGYINISTQKRIDFKDE